MPVYNLIKQRRFWTRLLILSFYILTICIIIPSLVFQAIKDGFQRGEHFVTVVGGVFVVMTLPMSFWLIIQHMVYYTKPSQQKHIIRILWMVPIYSLNAWFSILYQENAIYINCMREIYEAYVIYSFMMFLLNYLYESLGDDWEETISRKPQVYHIFPLCQMKPWPMGRELVHRCKHGILQYTVSRPITALIVLLCTYFTGGEPGFLLKACLFVVNNLSQFVAMYSLVLFYRATREELSPMNPILKFLCIKAVIFFSFFQGVIVTFLVYIGALRPFLKITNLSEHDDVASYIQNFLLCFEMFLAALAHHVSFSVSPYAEIICPRKTWKSALYGLFDFSDVGADIKEHIGVVANHFRTKTSDFMADKPPPLPKGEESPLLIMIPNQYATAILSPSINSVVSHREPHSDSNMPNVC